MAITPIYAALLAMLFIVLSIRTVRLRRRYKVAVGDGGNPALLRAMRVHANFAEYVPLTLLLIFMLESMGAAAVIVHGLCLCLVAGRVCHAYGVSQVAENYRYRVLGMSMTFTAMGVAAVDALITAIIQAVA
jgi:uncharacterized membrane protein YecN with MAPEG domain